MQWQRTADTGKLVADIFEKHPKDLYVMTHGNGPQVGNILMRAEMCRPQLFPLRSTSACRYAGRDVVHAGAAQ